MLWADGEYTTLETRFVPKALSDALVHVSAADPTAAASLSQSREISSGMSLRPRFVRRKPSPAALQLVARESAAEKIMESATNSVGGAFPYF